jgi:two-component system chemotaxis response regulator CheB
MGYQIAVIGGSAGGARALAAILAALPESFRMPVAVALHRGKESGDTLVHFLQRSTRLTVKEAQDKDALSCGCLYLAPPDYHLLVERDCVALSTEGPVLWARPSVDVLFESAADAWGERAVGVILSGASSDGALGLLRIKQRGGLALVQDPGEAESSAMPEAAMRTVRVDRVLPLAGIAGFLGRLRDASGG